LLNLTDTHCHLNLAEFDNDRDEVIKSAIEFGVKKIVIPGIDIRTSEKAIKLCEKYPENIYAAIGIHPNYLTQWNKREINQLRSLAAMKGVVAIGEIGLDYYRKVFPESLQIDALIAQLELAEEFNLPVCIHNREAEDDLSTILSNWSNKFQSNENSLKRIHGVLHSFSASMKFGEDMIDKGFFIGISGPVTFNKNEQFRKMISTFPLHSVLIETDSPYLTPNPFRGRRNKPENVTYIVEELAGIFNESKSKIAEITTQNAEICFKWD
jgi:TatD DNase family protein